MPSPQPLNLILSEVRSAAGAPVLSVRRRANPGFAPSLTVGEHGIPVSAWFYETDPNSSALSNVRHAAASIILIAKKSRETAAATLFMCSLLTEAQDENGDWFYSGTLDLHALSTVAAVQKEQVTVYCEAVINGAARHQFQIVVRPQVYTGDEVQPDTPEAAFLVTLLEEMQAAAAEADADAAAANAAKVAAEGFRDEAQGFRNEAEGFKNESETARDASETARDGSVAAKDISVTKAGEASASATAAAGSATTATTKAAEAAASAASIVPAPPNSFAKANERVGGDDMRLGDGGGFNNIGNLDWADGGSYMPAYLVPAPNLAGTRTAIFKIRPRWTDGRHHCVALFEDIGGSGEAELQFGSRFDGNGALTNIAHVGLRRNHDGQPRFASLGVPLSDLINREHILAVTIDAATNLPTLHFNGTALTFDTTPYGLTGKVWAIGHGVNQIGRFGGDIIDAQFLNLSLSDTKITECAKGEASVELTRKGFVPTSTGPFVKLSGAGNISGASASGFTADGPGYFGQPFDTLGKSGQKVRVTFTANAASGNLYVEQGAGGIYAFSAGANTLDIGSTDYGSPGITFQLSAGVTISAFSAVVVHGAIDRFTADQVSPDATLCGVFGTLLHAGNGNTPLAPNPGIVRTARVMMADVSVSANSEANSALSAVAGDEVSARLIAGLLPGYACRFTPDTDMPDGLLDKRGPKVTGAGALNLRIRNTTAGSLNTGAVVGTLTIHIR